MMPEAEHDPLARGVAKECERGRGEHTASPMAPLLATLAPPHILHLFALRDIAFSNSPIEAVNRTFKHYLRHWRPQTEAAFMHSVNRFVHDYAHVRPHGSLGGLTPFEAYTGHPMPDLAPAATNALQARMQQNRQTACTGCS